VKPRVRACVLGGGFARCAGSRPIPALQSPGCGRVRANPRAPATPRATSTGACRNYARAAARMAHTGIDTVPTSASACARSNCASSFGTHPSRHAMCQVGEKRGRTVPPKRAQLHPARDGDRVLREWRRSLAGVWLGPMHVELGEEAKKGPALRLRLHPRARWLDEEELRHRRHVLRAVGRSRGSDYLATEDLLGTERNATGVPGGYQLRCARS
jgi:hypothetical protein